MEVKYKYGIVCVSTFRKVKIFETSFYLGLLNICIFTSTMSQSKKDVWEKPLFYALNLKKLWHET